MALIDKVGRALLASLAIVSGMSCGRQPTGPSAAFKPATAADQVRPKGGDPVGALPSLVVSGQVAAFDATSTQGGIEKVRDAAGSLPNHLVAGRSALYTPGAATGAIDVQGAAGQDGEAVRPPLQVFPEERPAPDRQE